MLLIFSVLGGPRRCFVRDSGSRGKEGRKAVFGTVGCQSPRTPQCTADKAWYIVINRSKAEMFSDES